MYIYTQLHYHLCYLLIFCNISFPTNALPYVKINLFEENEV